MTREEAKRVVMATVRACLGALPASDWQLAAREISFEIMRLSNAPRSESGSFRLTLPLDDDEPSPKR